MNMIKGVLVVLIGLFLMVTVMSLFIPSKVVTTRGMPVHAAKEKILPVITDLKQWKSWQPVLMQDSSAVYSDPSTGVNASVQWTTAGKTNLIRITEQTPAGIKFLMTRPGEKDVENILSIAPLQDGNGYQVEWQALTHLKWYPWEKFAGIFTDKMTGPGYEAALVSLQKLIER